MSRSRCFMSEGDLPLLAVFVLECSDSPDVRRAAQIVPEDDCLFRRKCFFFISLSGMLKL